MTVAEFTPSGDPTDTTSRSSLTRTLQPDERPSVAIARAISALSGTLPWESDFVLNDYVDADALDHLLEHGQGNDLLVTLSIANCTVSIYGDGTLVVVRTQ